jgi:uncharacterized protein
MKAGGTTALLVFVKAPIPGEVKTRLCPDLTQSQACDLYRAMTEDLVTRLDLVEEIDVVLFHDPPEARETISKWLGDDRVLCAQRKGDLGERMEHAFSWAFTRGYSRVLIVGSDAPTLDGAAADAARRALDDSDVVVGPSPDGGYSLIGLRGEHPGLFRDISWSTETVRTETMARAIQLGLSVRTLPSLPDVDTFEDLERLSREEGDRLLCLAPRTAALMGRILDDRRSTSGMEAS